MYLDVPIQPRMGWQCPVCRTVNAPWSPVCVGYPKYTVVNSPVTSTTPSIINNNNKTLDNE